MGDQFRLPPPPARAWVVALTRRGFEALRREPGRDVPNRYHTEEVARSVAATLNACLLRKQLAEKGEGES